jgi:hypothetical protein
MKPSLEFPPLTALARTRFALQMCSWIAMAAVFALPVREASGQAANAKVREVATKHYQLSIEGTPEDAAEVSAVLEQAWSAYQAFFKLHPDDTKRLRVKLLASERSYLDTAWGDKALVPAQCKNVCWSETTEVVYLWGKPTLSTTRRNLLFGTALQFHALCKTKNRDLQRSWYEAGLAHAFSRHVWDGKHLVTMARPLVEAVDYPLLALRALDADPLGLPRIVDADLSDPILCWSAVGLCLRGARGRYREAFDKYALGVTGSKLPGDDFLRSLGTPANVARDLRAWLVDEQTPFECVAADWEDAGELGVIGEAEFDKVGLCILKEQADTLECTLGELPKQRTQGGLVTGYYGPKDYVLLIAVAPSLHIETWKDGRLVALESVEIPGDHVKKRKLKVQRVGVNALITIDDLALEPRELPKGRNGLFVSAGRASYTDVKWH